MINPLSASTYRGKMIVVLPVYHSRMVQNDMSQISKTISFLGLHHSFGRFKCKYQFKSEIKRDCVWLSARALWGIPWGSPTTKGI